MKKLIFAGIALMSVACFSAQAQTKDTAKRSMKSQMTKVATADVPASITAALKGTDYAGWDVSNIYANSDKTRYSVHATKGTEKKNIYFDQDGNVIQRQKKNP